MAIAPKKEQTAISNYSPDLKDMAILRLLQENARITVKEIGDKVH